MGLQSLHAKCVHVLLCVITCNNALSVRSTEKLVFVKMRNEILHAKGANIAETLLFVNMGDNALNAKNAEALLFVNMGENALNARSAEAVLFVNMGDNALNAKIVEAVLL